MPTANPSMKPIHFSAVPVFACEFRNEKKTPEKDDHMPSKTVVLIFAAVSIMVAAYGAANIPFVAEIQESPATKEVLKVLNVMDDARLRYTCIIGAVGGAIISIAMFSTPRFRPMTAKFVVSAVSGSMVTPAIMRMFYMPLDTDWILGASCVVAVCAYSVIQVLAPLVPMAVAWAFRQKYLPPENKDQP